MAQSSTTSPRRRLVAAAAVLVSCLLLGGTAPGAEARSAERRSRPSAPSTNLCHPAEQIIFSCTIGAKIVSVCGEGRGSASYRFGTPATPEIALASGGHGGTARFGLAQTGYSGGGEAQVQVTNGNVRYVVYSRIIRTGFGAGGNDPQAEAGVSVRKGGRTITSRRCTGSTYDASIDVAAAQRYMAQTEFIER